MFAVSGGPLPHTPALLSGYRRFTVEHEHYPGVVPSAKGLVDGIVYHNIPQEAWARLDRFEGEMYSRRLVNVRYENGGLAQVYCYVFRQEFRHRITEEEWDLETFLRFGKKIFQTQYLGYKHIEQD